MTDLDEASTEITPDDKKAREEFTKKLATRIREVRKEKGMTQEQLAIAAKLHLTYVAHLESGKYHPSVFVLWKIAKALTCSLDELAGN